MRNNILKMLATVLAVLSMTSCEDWKFLDEHPKKIDATTYMSDAEEVQSVINSIYGQFERDAAFGRYLSVLPEALSDYAYGRGNYNTSYETGLTTNGQTFVKDSWAVLYRAIRFSNEIMSQIDGADLSQTDYKHLTGEARYLRAFAYSFLVKYWGAVPFFDESNMSDFNKPRTPAETIWQYVVDEATYAAQNLPESASAAGHPTKYSALTLKGEALMYLERWSDAAEAFGEVISSGRYSLVTLSTADDFSKVYGVSATGTPEEVFYIKFNRDVTAKFQWMLLCNPNPVYPTGAVGIYSDYSNNKFVAAWDKNDFRYQWSLWVQTGNGALNAMTKTGMICLKYRDHENASACANDWPVYRYADVLLYCAEAICRRDGKPNAEAMEYVNMVRRRAYGMNPKRAQPTDRSLSDYPDSDRFMDMLLQERGYETCFEAKRYCDLKRCGLLAEYAVRAGKVASVSDVKDAAWWWPIPTDEFNYNTAMDPTKDQNPGY